MRLERIKYLINVSENTNGKYILYWMQQSQRIEYNYALSFAIKRANKNKLPILVYFGLTDNYPEANERHYSFMIEGLNELKTKFEKMGIGFIIKACMPDEGIKSLVKDAKEIVMDRGYIFIQRTWRDNVIGTAKCIS